MKDSGPIAHFLLQFRAELHRERDCAERIVAEVENHLAETAERLCAQGLPPDEAEREAVARFGPARDIAREFDSRRRIAREATTMLRILMTLLAVFTSSIALVIAIHSIVADVHEAPASWIAQKVIFSTAVVILGVLTLYDLWSRGSSSALLTRIIWVGAIGLIPLGVGAVIKTIHLGRVTGDWEMYIIAVGLAMICQGLLTIWNIWERTPKEA